MDLRVRHRTKYSYNQPVSFDPHKLMLRPRDSFDMRILTTSLTLQPNAQVNWHHDAYGNSVAIATFADASDTLVIESELALRRYASSGLRDARVIWMGGAPVDYNEDERAVLQPFMTPSVPDPSGALRDFAEKAVRIENSGERHPLLGLSQTIHSTLYYNLRFEAGTQPPLETLRLGSGTCRDFAWLFIEAARQLGYAARFVTGYLHSLAPSAGNSGADFSHAWAEVYVPGDGWIEFDPTNALVADRQLIRVAVTRTPREALPVSGSFRGQGAFANMDVSVSIETIFEPLQG